MSYQQGWNGYGYPQQYQAANTYVYGYQQPQPQYQPANTHVYGYQQQYQGFNSSVQYEAPTPVVYTDGACSNNGRRGAAAGYGGYWGSNHPNNFSEPLIGGAQTNNRAEYQAVNKALDQAIADGHSHITVRTDSKLLINSATKWMPNWERNGWKTASGGDVKNQPELRQLRQQMREIDVTFEHVPSHRGHQGNELADLLARQGAQKHYY